MKAKFLSKAKKIYLQAIGNGGEDKNIVIGIIIGFLMITLVIGVIIGTSFSGTSSISDGKTKRGIGKGFEGDYVFLLSHNILVFHQYRNKKDSYQAYLDADFMGLAPISVKIAGKNDENYKGKMTITTLMGNPSMTGNRNITREHTFELKNFMTSKDTLNFLISSSDPYSSSQNVSFALVKGKPKLLYISEALFEDFFRGNDYFGPCFGDCYCSDANPAFVKIEGEKAVFKELSMNTVEAEKQMLEKYRACLASLGHRQAQVMYIDSVLLRQKP